LLLETALLNPRLTGGWQIAEQESVKGIVRFCADLLMFVSYGGGVINSGLLVLILSVAGRLFDAFCPGSTWKEPVLLGLRSAIVLSAFGVNYGLFLLAFNLLPLLLEHCGVPVSECLLVFFDRLQTVERIPVSTILLPAPDKQRVIASEAKMGHARRTLGRRFFSPSEFSTSEAGSSDRKVNTTCQRASF
jgi:hypothetical protein